VPDRLAPTEAGGVVADAPGRVRSAASGARSSARTRPQHPGGEDAVEQCLNQGRAEEARAALALEAYAQRVFEGRSHRLERRRVTGRLDPREAVAGVGREQPREVFRLGERGPVGQCAREILAQTRADRPCKSTRMLLPAGRIPPRSRPAGTTPASPRRRPPPGRRGRTRADSSPAPGDSGPNSASPARAPPAPAGPHAETSPRRRRAPAPAPRAGGPAGPASRCRARNRDGPRPGRRARRRRTPWASASRRPRSGDSRVARSSTAPRLPRPRRGSAADLSRYVSTAVVSFLFVPPIVPVVAEYGPTCKPSRIETRYAAGMVSSVNLSEVAANITLARAVPSRSRRHHAMATETSMTMAIRLGPHRGPAELPCGTWWRSVGRVRGTWRCRSP